MPLGLSFAPGQDEMTQRQNGAGPSTSPIQEAIRVLSLRMPRVLGASSPAPAALLSGPGSQGLGGHPGNPIIEQLLRALLGGQTSGGPMDGLPGGAMIAPPMMPGPGPMGGGMSGPPLIPGFKFGEQPGPFPPGMPSGGTSSPMPPTPPPNPINRRMLTPDN